MVCNINVRNKILRPLDIVRATMDRIGLRQYDVSMRLITWTGSEVGDGTRQVQDIPIQLGGPDGYGPGGTHRPNVKLLYQTSQEVVASHGMYRAGDFMIGPFTPRYPLCCTGTTFGDDNTCFGANPDIEGDGYGGVLPDYFDPQVMIKPTEVLFNLKGPGMQPDGTWFKKIDQNVSRNLEYYFIIRDQSFITDPN